MARNLVQLDRYINVLNKMIGKPPTLCGTKSERRTKDRWEGVRDMCENHIDNLDLLALAITPSDRSDREIQMTVSTFIVVYDSVHRHEDSWHKSLEE